MLVSPLVPLQAGGLPMDRPIIVVIDAVGDRLAISLAVRSFCHCATLKVHTYQVVSHLA